MYIFSFREREREREKEGENLCPPSSYSLHTWRPLRGPTQREWLRVVCSSGICNELHPEHCAATWAALLSPKGLRVHLLLMEILDDLAYRIIFVYK